MEEQDNVNKGDRLCFFLFFSFVFAAFLFFSFVFVAFFSFFTFLLSLFSLFLMGGGGRYWWDWLACRYSKKKLNPISF